MHASNQITCNNCVTRGVFFFLRLRSLVFLISELRDCPLSKTKPEKTADILRRHHWFPREMASGKWALKVHTDDATLPKTPSCIWLVEANFPHSTTNEKHDPDPGICSRPSDLISRDESSHGVAKRRLFSRAIPKTALIGIPVTFLFFLFFFRLKS